MKLNYKTICKGLNEYAARDGYRKPAALRVEFTAFQPIHKVHRGRNGVGELVELQTQVIEADGIYIDPWDRSTLISVYVKARTRSHHGFGSDRGIFLRIRDAKGKYHSTVVRPQFNRDESTFGNLRRIMGEFAPCDYAAEDFKAYLEDEAAKVVQLVDAAPSEESERETRWKLEQQRRQFSEQFYKDLAASMDQHYGKESFNKYAEAVGCKIVTLFEFTDEFRAISPEFVDSNSLGIEFGWESKETYCSLPKTLKITKVREIKTVKLSDLGIEGAGYYSHDDRMRILPEQVAEARKFAARFRAKKTRVTEKLLTEAEEAA